MYLNIQLFENPVRTFMKNRKFYKEINIKTLNLDLIVRNAI